MSVSKRCLGVLMTAMQANCGPCNFIHYVRMYGCMKVYAQMGGLLIRPLWSLQL